jgi:peptidoglycan/xylan/chitin deacetylase (PgdA/CDA1 family)
MSISRLALLAFLLVLAVGLEPANAGVPAATPSPPPDMARAPRTADPVLASAGEPEAEPPAPRSDLSWLEPILDEDVANVEPSIEVKPASAAPIDPTAAPPQVTAPPTPAPTCPPAPAGLSAVPVVRNGARTHRVVALTFDDGWDADNTLRILRVLRGARVNATFFPLGRAIEASPTAWRTVAAAGYPIADHTDDHATLAGRCYPTQLAELTRFQSTARRVLGISPLPVMRPPGGAFDRTTRLAAAAVGERAVVIWDVDTRDWSGLGAGSIASRALDGQSGSIVLMHTYPDATAAALPTIIAGYRERGFAFVTIGTLLGLGGSVPYG